ncbi:GNAT family N-acetyltransferase [Dyella monticola]|uniref:GNAT family N-acetyltransferase n=1 Tax=Dyella monticola TaxID=1927958 RepID=A0A370X988_9GAMM|nr:GNAT family N-acetyltransferase [Dyella monticola]RDS84926.1 GNAT family N-acetyltransferase [Dyella monticola]
MLLRAAEPEDALAVARVHVRAWQVGYRHLLSGEYLAQLRPEERALRYDFATNDTRRPMTLVAVENDAIRGFATIAPARDSDITDHGELCALYVDPDAWGRGVGTALLAAARQRLVELGFRHAVLWLLNGNTRAARLYRADGWSPDGLARTDRIWGIDVDEIRFRRPLAA